MSRNNGRRPKGVYSMKYRIKNARGHYRVTRSAQGNIYCYTIMAQGSTIPRITYEPVQTFATLYTVNRVFNVWRTRPTYVPRFVGRCAQ